MISLSESSTFDLPFIYFLIRLENNQFELLHSNVSSFAMHHLRNIDIGNDWNGITVGVCFVVRFNFLYSNDIHKFVLQIATKR